MCRKSDPFILLKCIYYSTLNLSIFKIKFRRENRLPKIMHKHQLLEIITTCCLLFRFSLDERLWKNSRWFLAWCSYFMLVIFILSGLLTNRLLNRNYFSKLNYPDTSQKIISSSYIDIFIFHSDGINSSSFGSIRNCRVELSSVLRNLFRFLWVGSIHSGEIK